MDSLQRKTLIKEAFKSGNPKLKAMLLKHFVLLRAEKSEKQKTGFELAKQILLS
jgi:hypothetical protein